MKNLIFLASLFTASIAQANFEAVCKPQQAADDLRKVILDLGRLEQLQPHWLMVKRFPEQIPEWLRAQHTSALNNVIVKTMQYNALLNGCSCKDFKDKGSEFELELYSYQRLDLDKLKPFIKGIPYRINQITQGAESC